MTPGRNKLLLSLAAVIIFAEGVFIAVLFSHLHYYYIRSYTYESDSQAVERSYQILASRDGISIDRAKADSYAVAVHFPDKSCVEIRPTLDAVGGGSTFCYSREGTLIEHYDIGE